MPGGVVVLAKPGPSTNALVHALQARFEVERMVLERPESPVAILRRRARLFGLRHVAGQLAFEALVQPCLRRLARRRVCEIVATHRLDLSPPAVAIARVASANDPEAQALFRELRPAVVVVHGTRILSAAILQSIRAPFLNLHAGLTPAYRGVHGAWWALADRRPEACGVTLHEVDVGVDTGPILAQAPIKPGARDNFATYPWLQLAAGIPLLQAAVAEILAGKTPAPQAGVGPSQLRFHPTIGQYLRHLVRDLAR